MSTRCQVLVGQEGLDWKQEVMLYHHCDGYPTNILRLLREAWEIPDEKNWALGRAGKVASFICATDPGQFEPEQGLGLHGYIEWLYVVEARNSKGGCLDEKPSWYIRVYVPRAGFWEVKEPTIVTDMKLVAEGLVEEIVERAKEIEAIDVGE